MKFFAFFSRLEPALLLFFQPKDSWAFPCHAAKGRLRCRLHFECIQMYVKMERFIYLLFGADSSALRIDLRKIRLEDHEKIVKELLYVLDSPYGGLSEPHKAMPNLTELILKGKFFFVKWTTVH